MGILWPHSNAIAFNNAGARAPGAKAYFYEAGTTTPRSTYGDAALTTPHTHPVLADGNGRFPALFLDYGDYRERVRTAGDTAIWDTDNIPNAAPTDPGEGVSADAILNTGDVIFQFRSGTREGFARCNGRTIGSATSGATERANADCEDLFLYLWNNFSDTILAVSGGRGANAAADWSANKTIALPDVRGALLGGLADMGSSDAGHYNPSFIPAIVGNATTGGSTVGANTHALTTAQTPAHAHAFSATTGAGSAHSHGAGALAADSGGAHTHTGTTGNQSASHSHQYQSPPASQNGTFAGSGGNGWGGSPVTQNTATQNADHSHAFTTDSGGSHTHTVSGATAGESAHTHGVSGTTGSAGSDGHHNNMPRAVIGTWHIKL